jgi:serine/threonine protein phosphatase PrpC
VFGKSGSTFSLCLVDLTDGVLIVGNLGDSHVLLAEHYPTGWEVKRITKAHKPGSDAEKERIKEAGGVVNRELGSPRIGISLPLSQGNSIANDSRRCPEYVPRSRGSPVQSATDQRG